MLKSPFATLTYKEGMDMLLKNRTSFKSPPQDGADLGSEHELFLVQQMGGRPTFLIDWPADIKPFYMRTKDSDPNLVKPLFKAMGSLEAILNIFTIIRSLVWICWCPEWASCAAEAFARTVTIC